MIFQLTLIFIVHFWKIYEKSILIQMQFALVICISSPSYIYLLRIY